MIQEIVNKLTLEEKALLMSGKTVWETFEIEKFDIPSIFLADGPHGLRKQEGASDHLGLNKSIEATCFPTAATLANSWDPELLEEVGECIGAEAKKRNVQVVLGPGLNIKKNPLCGRNFEYFSEDPYLSGKMASGLIKGIQANGTIACPKHFAANNQEYRRMASDSIVDEQTLREVYLTGFEIAVKEGTPKSIMSAYNKLNGEYTNENEFLLRDILVDEWGFDGFVVSDWGGDNDHVKAVKNGCHLQMPSTGLNGPIEIVKAVKDGSLDEKILDQRVSELLHVISDLKINQESAPVNYEDHHQIAQKAAMKSIVLLKNENSVLPISSEKKIGIVGDFSFNPRYQGAGSSLVNPRKLEITTEIIDGYNLNVVGFEKGFHRTDIKDETLVKDAIDLAKQCDIILLYLGLDELAESEGRDRQSLKLAKNQLAIIDELSELDVSVVAVLSAGSVIDMTWEEKVDAVIHGYLSGEAGASAMLEVLNGNYSPSGKLNETYPIAYEDIPFSETYPEENEKSLYKEGIFVGYRYFDKAKLDVKYPFGYGLSYSDFEYENLEISNEGVTFSIKNIGKYRAEEVAQLYIGNPSKVVLRPEKELKGFIKVDLKPNEQRTVTIKFDDKSFRFFNTKTKEWEVEKQIYEIFVGSDSRSVKLQGNIQIEGSQVLPPYNINHLPNYKSGDITKVTDLEFEILYGEPTSQSKESGIKNLGRNNIVQEMEHAKSPVARFVLRRLQKMLLKSEKKGKPDLNLLFILNMPFIAIAKMTNGMISTEMIDAVLEMVNGRHIGGLISLISTTLRNRIERKNFKKSIGWIK